MAGLDDIERGHGGQSMKCLTAAECEQSVQGLGLEIEEQRLGLIKGKVPSSWELEIPDSARRQALGVNALFRAFADDTNGWLLWVLEWGAWPDEEYPELWHEIREHHGERHPIIETPGHLFEQEEGGLARGMTRLAMLFGWSAFLIPDPASFVVRLDARERMDLAAPAGSAIDEVAREITELWTKPW
jgi:hypothetical protein